MILFKVFRRYDYMLSRFIFLFTYPKHSPIDQIIVHICHILHICINFFVIVLISIHFIIGNCFIN